MVGAEFSGPFSGNRKRVSSDTCSQLVTVGFPHPAAVSFAEPVEPPPCTLMNSSCVRCIVELVSCLCSFMTHFELEQKFRFVFCLASFKIHIKQTDKIYIKQTASNNLLSKM